MSISSLEPDKVARIDLLQFLDESTAPCKNVAAAVAYYGAQAAPPRAKRGIGSGRLQNERRGSVACGLRV